MRFYVSLIAVAIVKRITWKKSLFEGRFEVWQFRGFPEKDIGFSKAFLGIQKQQMQVQHSVDNVLYLIAKLRAIGVSLCFLFAPKKV